MIRSLFLAMSLLAGQPASRPTEAPARPVLLAKAEKKPKKKKEGKKKDGGKGGPFKSCGDLTTKADCEGHAKDHSCSWDAISAGGSCGEGPPM